MKTIFVVGLIGSGKSKLCQFFEKKGAYYFHTDNVVADLYANDKELKQKLVKTFGQEILVHGKISKVNIAHIVFNNIKQLNILEKIIHPLIKEKLKQTIQTLTTSKKTILVIEMPAIKLSLLNKLEESTKNITILVKAKQALRQKRCLEKGMDETDFLARQSRQDESLYFKSADYIFENNASEQDFRKNATNLYTKINTI